MEKLEAMARQQASEMGISYAQYIGEEPMPMASEAYKYVLGKPLVRPEEVSRLSTQMRNLHEWYMMVANVKHPVEWLSVDVREEHYFKPYSIHIQLLELFQLYNQDALDKSIVSCYCL